LAAGSACERAFGVPAIVLAVAYLQFVLNVPLALYGRCFPS